MHTIVCIPAPGRAPLCTDACRSPERGLGVGHGREWGRGGYIGILWVCGPYQIPGGARIIGEVPP